MLSSRASEKIHGGRSDLKLIRPRFTRLRTFFHDKQFMLQKLMLGQDATPPFAPVPLDEGRMAVGGASQQPGRAVEPDWVISGNT